MRMKLFKVVIVCTIILSLVAVGVIASSANTHWLGDANTPPSIRRLDADVAQAHYLKGIMYELKRLNDNLERIK